MIVKKIAGLGLVLLGGLIAAHGGSTGQVWEIFAGLFLVVSGAILIVLKIVRRNTRAGQTGG